MTISNLEISKLTNEDAQNAFKSFYDFMMHSAHFRNFFTDEAQIAYLIKAQANNFFESLSMSKADFQENYYRLGIMHAKMPLPLEDMMAGLGMIRHYLLNHTEIKSSILYDMIEKMEKYLAKGYLAFQFEEICQQLVLAKTGVEGAYLEHDKAIIIRPLIWLEEVLRKVNNFSKLDDMFIVDASACPLTSKIAALKIETKLNQSIVRAHAEQHAIGQSFLFFLDSENYLLASLLLTKLFAISSSLSHQLGLAVSNQQVDDLQYDALTGLLLRHSLEQKVTTSLQQCYVAKRKVAFLMLDLDHFKTINDTLGHQAGDLVLKTLGELLIRNQRQGDLAFRYGGEEFLLVLPNVDENSIKTVAERLRSQIENLSIEWEGQAIPVTASLGGVLIAPEALNQKIEAFVKAADENLYQAKDTGRNKAVLS